MNVLAYVDSLVSELDDLQNRLSRVASVSPRRISRLTHDHYVGAILMQSVVRGWLVRRRYRRGHVMM